MSYNFNSDGAQSSFLNQLTQAGLPQSVLVLHHASLPAPGFLWHFLYGRETRLDVPNGTGFKCPGPGLLLLLLLLLIILLLKGPSLGETTV